MDGLEASTADLGCECLSVLVPLELGVMEKLVGDAAGMNTPPKAEQRSKTDRGRDGRTNGKDRL